ncbi:MAG: hypothetical protein M3N07_00690 [Pseudomonadota bacterium]|nr:hypothetical protein [Pseudomonadota bacterium]
MKRRRKARAPVRSPWTVKRATGTGVVAGLAALVLRLFYPAWPEAVHIPFLAACGLAALCGLSILWISAVDRLRYGRRRRASLLGFDLAIALLLAVPSLWTLWWLVGDG